MCFMNEILIYCDNVFNSEGEKKLILIKYLFKCLFKLEEKETFSKPNTILKLF